MLNSFFYILLHIYSKLDNFIYSSKKKDNFIHLFEFIICYIYRQIHTCCGSYLMMYNIFYSNTLRILCIRIINLEFQVSYYLISRVFHK